MEISLDFETESDLRIQIVRSILAAINKKKICQIVESIYSSRRQKKLKDTQKLDIFPSQKNKNISRINKKLKENLGIWGYGYTHQSEEESENCTNKNSENNNKKASVLRWLTVQKCKSPVTTGAITPW